ncbi:MAG: GNAT family protein [Bacillota bacterium]|nr:GNAT family protein [Bacillota bacterium]
MYRLEKFQEEEIEQFISWIPDARFLLMSCGPIYKMASLKEQLLKDIEIAGKEYSDKKIFKVVDGEDNKVIGHIQLIRIDYELKTAVIGRVVIGNPELRGKGIGSEVLNKLLKISFEEMGLETIRLNVYDFNKRAMACYKKVGFIVEKIIENASEFQEEKWTNIAMIFPKERYENGYA